jgi:hypothetical protein
LPGSFITKAKTRENTIWQLIDLTQLRQLEQKLCYHDSRSLLFPCDKMSHRSPTAKPTAIAASIKALILGRYLVY